MTRAGTLCSTPRTSVCKTSALPGAAARALRDAVKSHEASVDRALPMRSSAPFGLMVPRAASRVSWRLWDCERQPQKWLLKPMRASLNRKGVGSR